MRHSTEISRDTVALPLAADPCLGDALEPEELFGERYRASRLLAQGPGTRTLLGVDLKRGIRVIIQTWEAPTLPAGARMRFDLDCTRLRSLQSLWHAPVLDLGEARNLLFVVTPYIEGLSIASRLREGPLSTRESLAVGVCLFLALRDLHQHGVLHRNIKPANVIVNDNTAIQRATLCDVGLARNLLANRRSDQQSLDAALYASPELAGAMDVDVGEPSDLYSAGLVLYECLAGHPPFAGNTVGKILFDHVTAPVPDLLAERQDIPAALNEVLQRLLRKDPRDRYQSADAAVTDLLAILCDLDRGQTESHVIVGAVDQRASLTEAAFVARAAELDRIDEELDSASAGEPSLVLLEGESGNGKTRLLTEMSRRAVRRAFWVVRGTASTEVGQRPLQLFDKLVDEFILECQTRPGFADHVRQTLGMQLDGVLAAFPRLAEKIGWTPSHSEMPEEFGEHRSVQALAHFLFAIGTNSRPSDDRPGRLSMGGRVDDEADRAVGIAASRNEPRTSACSAGVVISDGRSRR